MSLRYTSRVLARTLLVALVGGCTLAFGAPPTAPEEMRRREFLENGAITFAQFDPQRTTFSVTLAISADNVRDTDARHGLRHVWEHFVARGDGTIDRRLERMGCYLTAVTQRDVTLFQIQGPVGAEELALDIIREMTAPLQVSDEALKKEVAIMAQEAALRTDFDAISDAAWLAAFGPEGRNPFGSLEAMAGLTAEDLRDLHRRQIVGNGMALVMVSASDPNAWMGPMRAVIGDLPSGPERFPDNEEEPISVEKGFTPAGAARAAVVPGLGDPATLATLAAALAIRAEFPDISPVYTPSTRPGLITLRAVDSATLKSIEMVQPALSFPVGQGYLLGWIRAQRSDPLAFGAIMGVLLLQRPNFTLDDMENQAATMTPEQFAAGLARFRTDRAVIVEVGGGQ